MDNNKNNLINLEKIKSLCLEKGLPFAEFGRRVGLDNRESISRRLKNQNVVTADELFLMADELGVDVNDLRLL